MSKKKDSLSNVSLTKFRSAEIDKSMRRIKNVVISISLFFLFLTIALVIYSNKQAKEKQNEKNLVGYTLKYEELVDTCDLVPVEGFYLGRGALKDEIHYIFQGEKNGYKSNNIDVPEMQIEIIYVPSSNSTEKPGTVKAYARTYTKIDKNKGLKTEKRYFYKVYIPKGTIKDVGKLVNDSESNDK